MPTTVDDTGSGGCSGARADDGSDGAPADTTDSGTVPGRSRRPKG